MRIVADLIGTIIFAIGILGALGGCLIMATGAGALGARMYWTGGIMVVVGWLISSAASRKQCPNCAKRVKGKALKCKHCGYDFSTKPSISISEPWGLKDR